MNTCAVPVCVAPTLARGWCGKHYKRWQLYGSTDATRIPNLGLPLREKFERQVVRSSDPATCWGWTGRLTPRGYTHISHKMRHLYGHRLSYEWFKGPIPTGLTIDHLCRKPACTNPLHLEAVTVAVNTLRGIGPSAINKTKTQCPQGHPYDAVNTYLDSNGRRHCHTCDNNRRRYTSAGTNGAKTACKRGHPFDEANTHCVRKGLSLNGSVRISRQCRRCSVIRTHAYRARRAVSEVGGRLA